MSNAISKALRGLDKIPPNMRGAALAQAAQKQQQQAASKAILQNYEAILAACFTLGRYAERNPATDQEAEQLGSAFAVLGLMTDNQIAPPPLQVAGQAIAARIAAESKAEQEGTAPPKVATVNLVDVAAGTATVDMEKADAESVGVESVKPPAAQEISVDLAESKPPAPAPAPAAEDKTPAPPRYSKAFEGI